jgi:hypothetical protein
MNRRFLRLALALRLTVAFLVRPVPWELIEQAVDPICRALKVAGKTNEDIAAIMGETQRIINDTPGLWVPDGLRQFVLQPFPLVHLLC